MKLPRSSPRDSETGPVSTGDVSPRDLGSPLGMKALGLLVRIAPRFIVYWFAMFPVVWYYVTRSEGRKSSAVYQRMLGLKNGPIRRFFFGLGQAGAYSRVILDNMYLGHFGPQGFSLEKTGFEAIHGALEKGGGLILLSAHVGNWHLAVNFLHDTDTTVHLVIDDVRQAEVKRQMDEAKKSSGHLIVHDAAKGPELVFELSAALKRGEVVILAGDRARGERKAKAKFLGGEAWFPTTAFSLAKAAGAPVCAAWSFRTGMQRYECIGVGPIFDGSENTIGDRSTSFKAAAEKFAFHLEESVRRFPKQWFNFFDFWAEK